MARVRNLSKEMITTITAGNLMPGDAKEVPSWEAKVMAMLHGKRLEVSDDAPKAPQKKGKK